MTIDVPEPKKTRITHPGILRLVKGTIIGENYCIIEALGQSVVGRGTFKAEHIGTKMPVVLKVFPERSEMHAIGKDLEDLIRRERDILIRMQHPHIQRTYAIGGHLGQEYIVLEYIEGTSLADKMDLPMPCKFAARYGGQLLRALDFAHTMGVVHRNVEPSSIILTKKGVKLVGFGIAKVLEPDLTSTDSIMMDGEVTENVYIAPEVLSGEGLRTYTPKSDVYSVAMVLYHAIAQRLPFDGDAPMIVNLRKLSSEPAALNDVDPEFGGVLIDMLRRDPEYRPTAAEAAAAIESWDSRKQP